MTQKYFEKSSTKVKQPHSSIRTVVGYSFARKIDIVLVFKTLIKHFNSLENLFDSFENCLKMKFKFLKCFKNKP